MERKITSTSFFIAAILVFLMWVVFLLDYNFDLDFYLFGVYPKQISGLVGIIFSPFIHSTRDYGHILNNSVPIFVLTFLLFYHYRKAATYTFLTIYFLTGVGVWLMARENYHIGMSGVIYGLASYLIVSGFFKQNLRIAGISLLVVFLYGSIIWGIFPQELSTSWEGHALGLFSGVICAFLYKEKSRIPEKKYLYEIHEEMGIEPEEEYWKEDYISNSENVNQIIPPPNIRYEFIPKKLRVNKPMEEE